MCLFFSLCSVFLHYSFSPWFQLCPHLRWTLRSCQFLSATKNHASLQFFTTTVTVSFWTYMRSSLVCISRNAYLLDYRMCIHWTWLSSQEKGPYSSHYRFISSGAQGFGFPTCLHLLDLVELHKCCWDVSIWEYYD